MKPKNNKGLTIDQNRRNVDRLTPSEERIWKLHEEGKSRPEIAEALGLARSSVDRRMATIREKQISSRSEQ